MGRFDRKKIAQLIIARLDGKDINKKFKYYESLVKKGIGGFIIFGGKLKEVSKAIKKLQDSAETPLFIAADLEQGLGQHIEGGTLFPPPMAVAQAINPKNKKDVALLRKSINIIAREAKAAGINIIFAPVLDVNTNPQNPIICTRAFSDNPKKVAGFGNEFIRGFQKNGIIACGKHFPGHGDTIKDSHRELPIVHAGNKRLNNIELYPFSQAITAGVKMIMLGHLKVPALDSRLPVTLSRKIIQGILKEKMKFKGLVITDAMNMKAISMPEEKACLMALNAGADILLHPGNPEKIIDYLYSRLDEIKPRVEESYQRIIKAKEELNRGQRSEVRGQKIGSKSHQAIAKELTQKSIKIISNLKIPLSPPLPKGEILFPSLVKRDKGRFYKRISLKSTESEKLIVLVIDDDNAKSGKPFVNALRKKFSKINACYVDNKTISSKNPPIPPLSKGEILFPSLVKRGKGRFYKGGFLIIAVFSKISAWKGRSGLSGSLEKILKKAVRNSEYSVIAGFCCPYFLRKFNADVIIEAYSDSEQAQKAAAEVLAGP
ncbi:MAG: glycoside hydrolase family 3 N-terminal domain-containing protein [Nitrospirota bacterium]